MDVPFLVWDLYLALVTLRVTIGYGGLRQVIASERKRT